MGENLGLCWPHCPLAVGQISRKRTKEDKSSDGRVPSVYSEATEVETETSGSIVNDRSNKPKTIIDQARLFTIPSLSRVEGHRVEIRCHWKGGPLDYRE